MGDIKFYSHHKIEELDHQMMEETLRGLATILSGRETNLKSFFPQDSYQHGM